MNASISVRRIEPETLTRLPNSLLTQDDAAMIFIERHGDNLRFCHTTGSWFIWRITHWAKDETNQAFQMARLLVRELTELYDARTKVPYNKTSFASGVDTFSRADPMVAVTHGFWDMDPWLLGTPGGTVDLRTGILRDSLRDDLITKVTNAAPLGEGCPLWLKFLNDSTGGDQDFIRFLQQWSGYCLTGTTSEQALLFLYGSGGNGKSVFLNTMIQIFGDYAATAAMDTFTASQSDRHPTDVAKLRGARLVTASETEAGRAWAEARIKNLTGGDPISARFMHRDFFEYKPAFKLMIVGNHKPVLSNVDDAMKRRFNIAPFVLKPQQPDKELESKLLVEAGGILQWMIDGCIDWQRNGLLRPECVQVATKQYFDEQDLLGQWIEDSCVAEPENRKISGLSGDLFDSWSAFCKQAGEDYGSKKAFGLSLQKRGFVLERDSSTGHRLIRGIRLRVDHEEK
jgi:putative DNA primase/helicase